MTDSRPFGRDGRSYEKRNLVLNVLEGAFYVTGASLISSQTVLPALLGKLGGGNIAIGALGVVNWMFVLIPQVFASRRGQLLEWKKPWVVKFGALQRALVLVMGITIYLGGAAHSVSTIPIFLCLFALNQLILGATSPIWFDFYAKLVGKKYRGRSLGLRAALAGIMSLGGSFLLAVTLRAFNFPVNFALAFAFAFIFESGSLLMQTFLVESEPSRVVQHQSMREYALQLAGVLKENVGFRRFLASCSLLVLATMPLSFFIVYAIQRFAPGESVVGDFTIMMVSGQVIGALIVGHLADRYNNKVALLATSLAMLGAIGCALLSPSLVWYRIVFVLLGVYLGSELLIRYNFAIEFGPVHDRPLYLGLMNTLLGPFYLSGLLGGWISNEFGYQTLFFVSAVCSLAGILFLGFGVREPRLHEDAEPLPAGLA